jgi:biotin transport system permease protein/energy-coupling factor transport system permease protein
MRGKTVVFRYKKGNSLLHRAPALLKLSVLAALAISIMFLPLSAVCAGIAAAIIPALVCGFSVKEQLTDIRPALFYALFLCMISACSGIVSAGGPAAVSSLRDLIHRVRPAYEYGVYIVRLILVMQVSALLFRTSSSIEIKEAVCGAETALRRVLRRLPGAGRISPAAKFGNSIALTISFIPVLFELWEKLNRAYRARGGRGGLTRFRLLIAALIALSFHYAAQKARALQARECL